MASKARKKSAAATKKKRKTVAKKRSTLAAGKKAAKRKKVARRTKPESKPKGVIADIVGAAEAVVDTLTDAERLHRKLEPHVSREPE